MFITLLRQAQFHGAIRLAENSYRWLWAVALSMLLGCSITVVLVTVNRYFENPTFLVRQETIYSTTPFPSVRVCPEIIYPDAKIDQFIREVQIPPELNSSYIRTVIHQLAAYYSPDMVYLQRDLKNIEHLLQYNGLDVDTTARRLTTTCEETLIRCRWQGSVMNCSLLFDMEMTGDGYCCVFNGRSLSREIMENGIQGNVSNDQWFTNIYGYSTGLTLAINQTQKLDNVDLSYKWLALQGHQHYVETPVNGTALSPGSELWASYTTQGFQIGDYARTLSHRLRRCQMANQPLKLFPLYHKKYCILECEIERTIKRCNCARANHPKPPGIQTCKARSLRCAKHAMVSADTEECDCPQACDVAHDIVQTTSFQLTRGVQTFDTFYNDLNYSTVTIVRVFVKKGNIQTKERWSYFSTLDLFAQLGGVFNVFFGVSILSILELIQLIWHGLQIRNRRTVLQRVLKVNSKPTEVIEERNQNDQRF